MKHEVMLTYQPVAPTPVSTSVLGDKILTRQSAVSRVEVMSRAACGAQRERLRGYVFLYTPDADTTLPRLHAVRTLGRQGTPEMDRTLPLASYDYGAATKNEKLHYERTQTVAIPAGAETWNISGTVENSTVTSPVPGTRYAMSQSLTDVNGDGRADLIFLKNSKLWVARNRPAPGGRSMLVGQSSLPLSDATFAGSAYSTHSSTKRRFSYAATNFAANRNTINVWRQAIDVNGDGRLDIIDAAEKAGRWVVYLNTPGGGVRRQVGAA